MTFRNSEKKGVSISDRWHAFASKYQKNVAPAPHSIWTNPLHFIACGFGIGAFPFFPGTMGTLAAIPLIFILNYHFSWIGYVIACLVLFVIGLIVTEKTNADFGTQDHPAAVIDELATFPVALFAVPLNWHYLLAGFVLFRFFDIAKPGPIRWVDKHVHGGIGVMLDDLLAAIATVAILQFVMWVVGTAPVL